MTKVIIYGLICAVALYAYRAFKSQTKRVPITVRKNNLRRTGAKATLVQDPKTGQYYVERP